MPGDCNIFVTFWEQAKYWQQFLWEPLRQCCHIVSWEVKFMSMCSCRYKCNCVIAALIVSLIIGIVTAFLQITAVITVTPAFLWVLFGIAVGLLAILLLSSSLQCRIAGCTDQCSILDAVLLGILGTILFAVVLLAVGIVATSVISAILVGLLLFSFSLALTALACYVRCVLNCAE